MGDCCSKSNIKNKSSGKRPCPVNQLDYVPVPFKTVLHHLNKPWNSHLKNQEYYFCDDPDCEVVYFAEDNSVIYKSELRTLIAIKEQSQEVLLCHCFGISKNDLKQNPEIKNFVIQQTKIGHCSCETSNPSGRCCLKDFP